MAGMLQFTLGLETSNFLRGIGLASGQILSFSGLMSGVASAGRQVWAAFERGGALSDLAARTGQTAGAIFSLQEAFKVVGLESGNVSRIVLYMQRALGGVDEQGQKTDDVFRELGLDAKKLTAMDAPRQLTAMAGALAKVGKERAAFLGGRLFGQEGVGDALQIARDMESFRAALAELAPAAGIYDRMAGAFDRIGDTVALIRSKMSGMWAGIAEGAVHGVQRLLDYINRIDWVGIGQRIGKVMGAFSEAFVQGRFGELWTLTLQAGVMEASNLMLQQMGEWGVKFRELLFGPTKKPDGPGFLAKAGYGVMGVGYGLLGLNFEARSRLGFPGAQYMADAYIDSANDLFGKAGIKDGILQHSAEAMVSAAQGRKNEFAERLAKLIEELAAAARAKVGTPPPPDDDSKPKPLELGQLKKGGDNMSAWERIGLILGGGRSATDYARVTSENTRALIQEAKRTNQILAANGPVNFNRIS